MHADDGGLSKVVAAEVLSADPDPSVRLKAIGCCESRHVRGNERLLRKRAADITTSCPARSGASSEATLASPCSRMSPF